MTSKQVIVVALLLGVVGCNEATICDCVPTIDVSATSAWGGSEITLTSPGFVGRDTLPLVLADAETLAVRFTGAATVSVTLPGIDRIGTLTVVLSSGEQLETPSVQTYGYVDEIPIAHTEGDPQDYPAAGNPVVLVYRDGRPVGFNLETLVQAPFTSPSDTGFTSCTSGPAVAWDPTVITVGRANKVVAVASQSPHAVVDSTSLICSSPYPAVNLGPGLWLVNQKTTMKVVNGATTTSLPVNCDGFSFRFGPPQRKLVVPIYCRDSQGVPVFDGVTTNISYHLDFLVLLGATFAPGGDTLYALGQSRQGPSVWLKRIDPATGIASDSVLVGQMPDLSEGDVVADPQGPWLYVSAGNQGDRFPTILVYRRSTLERVAVVRAPLDEDNNYLFFHHLVVAPGRELYLMLSTNRSYAQARLHRWTLMP